MRREEGKGGERGREGLVEVGERWWKKNQERKKRRGGAEVEGSCSVSHF